MCQHDVIEDAGNEKFNYWEQDVYCQTEFQLVRCLGCDHTFLLDELHGLG